MGFATCAMHGARRGPRCCWRCDGCPVCDPKVGRLLKGDYCRECTEKMKAEGLVWSNYFANWVSLEEKTAAESPNQTNLFGGA